MGNDMGAMLNDLDRQRSRFLGVFTENVKEVMVYVDDLKRCPYCGNATEDAHLRQCPFEHIRIALELYEATLTTEYW